MDTSEGDRSALDQPTRYMERTRLYYRALGYKKDYVWATNDDMPFSRLEQPLAATRVALLTTASPPGMTNRDARGQKQVWTGKVAEPPTEYVTEVAWDRDCTHTDDPETFLPLNAAKLLLNEGRIGSLAEHFVGVPTKYSQRATIEIDAPIILRRLEEDEAHAAILTAL